jgi:hypothetical protein
LPLEVDVGEVVKGVLGHLGDRRRAADTRVEEQQVKRAEALPDDVDHRGGVSQHACIGADHERALRQFALGGGDRLGVLAGDRDLVSASVQQLGGGFTDPGRATGDEAVGTGSPNEV